MALLTKARFKSEANDREKRNLQVAYEAACESIVLLENDGTLPISVGRVALYGSGARKTIKGGSGSGEVNERHSVSVYEGMKTAGFTIATEDWIDEFDALFDKEKSEFESTKIKKIMTGKMSPMSVLSEFPGYAGRGVSEQDVKASNTDTCIYVLARQAGEGLDRKAEKGDMFVTDVEEADIAFCAKHFEKFILVINAGAQLDMSFLDKIEGINAVVFMCQLGTAGGTAVADVLSGKVTPSGKLASTWAKRYADIPFSEEFSYLNGNLDDEYYKEGIYVGYRYFDTFEEEPRYPFGYGKSYTDFAIEKGDVTLDGTKVQVKANVKNVGDTYSGKEVVEVYVSAPAGTLDKEYQSLVGFAKTKNLAPGESEEVTVTFDMKNVSSYHEGRASYILETGAYLVRLGNSSRNTCPCAVLELNEEIVVSKHENICPVKKSFLELKAKEPVAEPVAEGVPHLEIDPNAFSCETYEYKTPEGCNTEEVRKFVSGLTLEEMVEIIVGIGMFGGYTRFTLPGAVGNTTSKFWDRGLVNITLCDGPAGLRIQRRTALLKDGSTKMIDPVFSFIGMLPKVIQKKMLADPEKSTIIYQFATAFPVSAALAQSWNTEVLYKVGLAVHEEMKEYGATYWLAPGLNIHRNPLCGRNFEYYSEDPFLTGAMASAITKGVQSEEGYYVAIKHFAANNQEENRKGVSSNVSERAFREIYLRGFERTVKEGGAKGVMTSYNRINGVYAPNNYDLCTKVLRNEWGYKDVIMTDWFATGKDVASPALCMAAGNDLIMPGVKKDKKDILDGVKKGIISEEQVRRCCSNVVNAILNSALQKEYMS